MLVRRKLIATILCLPVAACTTMYSSTTPEGQTELWQCGEDDALAIAQEAIGRVFPRANPVPISGYQAGLTWWHMPLLDRTDFRLTLTPQRGNTTTGEASGYSINVNTYGTQGLVSARYIQPLMAEIRKVAAERGVAVVTVTGARFVSTGRSSAPGAAVNRSGSGFFVSAEGHLITNEHVVRGATRIELVMSNGVRVAARVLSADASNDIALLKAETQSAPLAVAASDAVAKGSDVFTLGYPLVGIQGQEQKATFGRINALSGVRGDIRFFQIDVPIQPGNSGGPLLADDGRVVGIVTASLDQLRALKQTGALPQSVNYAVKADYIFPLLRAARIGEGSLPRSSPGTRKDLNRLELSVVQVLAQ